MPRHLSTAGAPDNQTMASGFPHRAIDRVEWGPSSSLRHANAVAARIARRHRPMNAPLPG